MFNSELLLPAGSLKKLKIAILYGADAVYAGTPDLSLRTKADFSLQDAIEGSKFAKQHGKKMYLTMNLFTHNRDISKLESSVQAIKEANPDGVIVADPAVFSFIKEKLPNLELHISTQANVCSWLSVDYWKKQGADLCVLAREVSFSELTEIREKCPDIKLEAFVHGSMCMTYSGRCLLSNYMAERGSNQGNCAHSCRWNYKVKIKLKDGKETELTLNEETKELFEYYLEEEFREGEYYQIEEDSHGSYILNSKDLCLLPVLPEYLKLGVDSLKVEGRHKTEYYVGMVGRVYRKAIDDYRADPSSWNSEIYMDELYKMQSRGFTLGFHEGRLTNIAHNYDRTRTIGSYLFAGIISEHTNDSLIMEVRNTLKSGDVLEFMSPHSFEPIRIRMYDFTDAVNNSNDVKATPGGGAKFIKIPFSAFHTLDRDYAKHLLPPLTIVRKEAMMDAFASAHISLDKQSFKSENKIIPIELYEQRKEQIKLNEVSLKEHIGKTPKSGTGGCCGKGCNGCLVFWYDSQYENMREQIKSKYNIIKK